MFIHTHIFICMCVYAWVYALITIVMHTAVIRVVPFTSRSQLLRYLVSVLNIVAHCSRIDPHRWCQWTSVFFRHSLSFVFLSVIHPTNTTAIPPPPSTHFLSNRNGCEQYLNRIPYRDVSTESLSDRLTDKIGKRMSNPFRARHNTVEFVSVNFLVR